MIGVHKVGCQCGRVRFTARFDKEAETSRCNCSICTKTRLWKAFVPAQAFTVDSGESSLGSYRFGSGAIDHQFCINCGVKLFGRVPGEDGGQVAISVPCLDLSPEQLAELAVTYQDGRCDRQDRPPAIASYL